VPEILVRQPPSVFPSHPGPGFDADFGRDPIAFLSRLASQHGDMVHFPLRNQPIYLVSRPEWIATVLSEQADRFVRNIGIDPRQRRLFGISVTTGEGDFWKADQAWIRPEFQGPEHLAFYTNSIVEAALSRSQGWADGQEIDVLEEMCEITMRALARCLWGLEGVREIDELSALIQLVLDLFLSGVPKEGDRLFWEYCERLDDFIEGVLKARLADGRDRGDLLSRLVRVTAKDDRKDRFNRLRDHMVSLSTVGFLPFASAMCWAWFLLARHPDSEAALHGEVDEAALARPEAKDFTRFPVARRILAETLRLYPPLFHIVRHVAVDTVVGDYLLPARSAVMVSPSVLHRDARFFDEPDRFRPDRWVGQGIQPRVPFSYLPFGAGPRRCMGESFAWMSGSLLLATVARRWRLRWEGNEPVAVDAFFAVRPVGGLMMRLERRPSVI